MQGFANFKALGIALPKLVNHAASPYTLLISDTLLEIDPTDGAVNIQLPDPTKTKQLVTLYDSGGVSSANFINLVPFAAETIWGLAGTFPLAFNKGVWSFWPTTTGNWWVAGPI
jgi:hypothetical protein